MKVVHVHVKLETPEEAAEVARMVKAILALGLKDVRPDWTVKEVR